MPEQYNHIETRSRARMASSSYYNDDGRSRRGNSSKVDTPRYYSEYHGHLVEHLEQLLPALRESSDSLIWTAGDSSLDNKYWFSDYRPAVGAYRDVLDPPTMNADVTYWLNRLAGDRAKARKESSSKTDSASPPHIATINTAIEATTLQHRTWRLLAQDAFLRDNLESRDTLIVSIGGNDVANAPTPCTIAAMLSLVKLPMACLEHSVTCWTPPCNEHCYGCGPVSMLSCCTSVPPCLGYTNHLFGSRVKQYIQKLVAKTKPKRVLVCMIYYLDETPSPSWAGVALKALGYDADPERLQFLIRRMFQEAVSKIDIPGTTVIPVPLFEVLDGKTSGDYEQRVEPSSQGGQKMAEYLLDIVERDEQSPMRLHHHSTATPVESSYMLDRS